MFLMKNLYVWHISMVEAYSKSGKTREWSGFSNEYLMVSGKTLKKLKIRLQKHFGIIGNISKYIEGD